jgi:hypothetical protein
MFVYLNRVFLLPPNTDLAALKSACEASSASASSSSASASSSSSSSSSADSSAAASVQFPPELVTSTAVASSFNFTRFLCKRIDGVKIAFIDEASGEERKYITSSPDDTQRMNLWVQAYAKAQYVDLPPLVAARGDAERAVQSLKTLWDTNTFVLTPEEDQIEEDAMAVEKEAERKAYNDAISAAGGMIAGATAGALAGAFSSALSSHKPALPQLKTPSLGGLESAAKGEALGALGAAMPQIKAPSLGGLESAAKGAALGAVTAGVASLLSDSNSQANMSSTSAPAAAAAAAQPQTPQPGSIEDPEATMKCMPFRHSQLIDDVSQIVFKELTFHIFDFICQWC